MSEQASLTKIINSTLTQLNIKMFIFIKTLSGKTIAFDVELTETISSLKNKIKERENVPIEQQRILFAGKELDDLKDLSFYNVGKEAILHLVLKKVETNMQVLTKKEQSEMRYAQSSSKMAKYYNPSVGLNDELVKYKDSESKFDRHANPEGSEYDLGKDGEFKDYNILIGHFDFQCLLRDAKAALEKKGFGVDIESNLVSFCKKLSNPKINVAWIISGSSFTGDKKPFIQAVEDFNERGGGLMVWGDNAPYFAHANVILPSLLKTPELQLVGNTPGGKNMTVGEPTKTRCFGPHIITTGIVTLFEGITICYPNKLGPLKVLATSSDEHPAVCYADNESLKSDTRGRIIVDCGWTKNYCSWHEAGTARYVSNATIWLLGLEHKFALEDEEGTKSTSTTSTKEEIKPDEKATPDDSKVEKKEIKVSEENEKKAENEEVQNGQEVKKEKSPKKERRMSVSQRLKSFFK